MTTKKNDSKILATLDDFEQVKVKGKDKLGKGSFASVSLVRHKKSRKLFALKEVKKYLKIERSIWPTATI